MTKWIPELKKLIDEATVILVGLQTDIRKRTDDDSRSKATYVSTEQGGKLAKKLPGIFCEPITPSDARWQNLPRIWISENAVYYPKNVPNGIVIQGMTCRTSEPFLPHPVCNPIENNQLTSAVKESLSSSGLEMGEFKYLNPLSLSNPRQIQTLEARMGGHNLKKVQLTLENVHGGSEILTPKGQATLGNLT